MSSSLPGLRVRPSSSLLQAAYRRVRPAITAYLVPLVGGGGVYSPVLPKHRENKENGNNNNKSLSGKNAGSFEILPNTRNFVCSSWNSLVLKSLFTSE